MAANTNIRERVQDPVCGMDVDPAATQHRIEHAGRSYHFCGARCADTFRKDPGAALKRAAKRGDEAVRGHCGNDEPAGSQPGTTAASAKYICPMCPGVESDGPSV